MECSIKLVSNNFLQHTFPQNYKDLGKWQSSPHDLFHCQFHQMIINISLRNDTNPAQRTQKKLYMTFLTSWSGIRNITYFCQLIVQYLMHIFSSLKLRFLTLLKQATNIRSYYLNIIVK